MFAKISGLDSTMGRPSEWAEADIRPYIGHTLDVFGPRRCMLGGDWPIVKLSGGYERAIHALDCLSPAEQAAVRSETAVEVYRLDAQRSHV